VLNPAVEDFLHFRAARVGDDAAITKRAWTPFGPALKPAENFSIRDDRRGAAGQIYFGKFSDGIATLRQAIRIDCAANLFTRVSRSPVSVIHHEAARLAEFLMPYEVGGANCQTSVSRCRMNVNLFERRGIKDFSVRHAIESHAACQTNGLQPR